MPTIEAEQKPDAPRCPLCCEHGVPRAGHWCGWCDDLLEGCDDCYIGRTEEMWLCDHGIGKAI